MAGKGDKPRPRVIDDSEWQRRWKLAFENGDRSDKEGPEGSRDRTGPEED